MRCSCIIRETTEDPLAGRWRRTRGTKLYDLMIWRENSEIYKGNGGYLTNRGICATRWGLRSLSPPSSDTALPWRWLSRGCVLKRCDALWPCTLLLPTRLPIFQTPRKVWVEVCRLPWVIKKKVRTYIIGYIRLWRESSSIAPLLD